MKTMFATAAFALIAVTTIGNAHAAAGDLAKCYDRVINSCNKGNHAQSCSESGMNQCDKVYPRPLITQQKFNLAAPTRH